MYLCCMVHYYHDVCFSVLAFVLWIVPVLIVILTLALISYSW